MRLLAICLAASILGTAATPLSACPAGDRLLFIDCSSPATARLLSLDGKPVPKGPEHSLTVTGAYSSADRFGIEGLAIENGTVVSNRFQAWDGLAVITPAGQLSLHHVARIGIGESRFNLRSTAERRAFVAYAGRHKLSVIQSHLLITDGAVDVRNRPDQPRARRRILFVTEAGEAGIFDSGPEVLTLFEAASAVMKAVAPKMAFNLDMGTYDYCAWNRKTEETCGRLQRRQTNILTNVLIFTFPPQNP